MYDASVDLLEIKAVLRRQVIASVAICACGVGAAYTVYHADPGYQEAGVIAITAPKSAGNMFAFDGDQLIVEKVLSRYLSSSSAIAQINSAGGSASYSIALVNENNEEFPYYRYPYIDITTSSSSLQAAKITFEAVLKAASTELSTLQRLQGVASVHQISATVASEPSGPVSDGGSRKRSLFAIVLITLISVIMGSSMIDRRRRRQE